MSKNWFDSTFSSRAATEQLLRPDLESGLLTQHDFDLAVSFLPGNHRYLPFLHSVISGAAAGAFLYRSKRGFNLKMMVVGMSSAVGYSVGFVHYFRKHKQFSHQLDDPPTFLLALENVNRRLGHKSPLIPNLDSQKIFERVKKRREEHGETFTPLDNSSDVPEGEVHTLSGRAPTKVADAPPARQKSTWEAIREANSQNTGRPSSWEELRQRHERQHVSARVPVRQEGEAPTEPEDPRAKAQAEFDAILEAERKAARG